MVIGIDLSMRSTGLCSVDNTEHSFMLVRNETEVPQLFTDNANDIIKIIQQQIDNGATIEKFHLEALSLRSVSGSADKIIGNHWYVRTRLFEAFPSIPLEAIEVLTWRSPHFNKEERKQIAEYKKQLEELKATLKGVSRKERAAIALENEEIILGADIKHQTFLKLPKEIQEELINMNVGDAKYDLTDAWFVAHHKGKK